MYDWSLYLKPAHYEYLVQYIENIKHGLPNDKMIILAGEPRTGKSTLMNDIAFYLGTELCGNFPMSCAFNENNKKLGFLHGLDDSGVCTDKNIQTIVNFIKNKQSFIACVQDELNVSYDLTDHCYVIQMDHVFE
jgi:ABC-type branched-subunit amino acid transport system ATPase component